MKAERQYESLLSNLSEAHHTLYKGTKILVPEYLHD